MRKYLPWGLIALLFLLLQFWPSPRSNPPARFSGPIVDPRLAPALRESCYDCHSNQTRWPWYTAIQPARYIIVKDVEEGRAELNFDNWAGMDPKQRSKKLLKSADEIIEGEMPPKSYVVLHPSALLSQQAKEQLVAELRRLAAIQH